MCKCALNAFLNDTDDQRDVPTSHDLFIIRKHNLCLINSNTIEREREKQFDPGWQTV